MTHGSFNQGLRAFFSCAAHRFPPDGVDNLTCHELLRQHVQRPGRTALWRLAAGDSHAMRFLRAVEFAWLRAGGWLAAPGGFQSVLDHPLASPLERGRADIDRGSDLPVVPARAIDRGLQQYPCP